MLQIRRGILFVTLSIIALVLIIGGVIFVKKLSYFRITDIEVIENNRPSQLKARLPIGLIEGKNIFEVDLAELSQNIKKEFPEIREVKASRHLPNKLILQLIRRVPVAQINLGGYFLVDKQGFTLPEKRFFPFDGFPIIDGAAKGESLTNLKMALSLLEKIASFKGLEGQRVTKIEIASPKDFSFFFEDGLKVIIGEGDFNQKLEDLALFLPELQRRSEVEYIDLRFKEPIVKWK